MNRIWYSSLRWRLTFGYALVFALTVMFGSLGVYLATQTALIASLDATLRDTATVALGNIDDPPAPPKFTKDLKPISDLAVELLDARGKRLDVVGLTGDERPKLVKGFAVTTSRRWFTIPTLEHLWLRVSRSDETPERLLETLAQILILASVVMVAVACAFGFWLADRALHPVDAVARTAARIANKGNFNERVPSAPGQDEMARLTGTVNAMLERLELTLEREKGFARAAAHELRTPLTTIKGRLELALERPREASEYRRHLEIMQESVHDLSALVNQLDTLARADAPVQLEPVVLDEIASEVLKALQHSFEHSGKQLESSLKRTSVLAERAGVQQVLVNLLENARKYGGSVVTLSVGTNFLEVRDTGAGPAPETWSQLLRPFERGSSVHGISGSGLGLPLVAALIARWDASLEPDWSEQGFAVRVTWVSNRST